MRTELVKTNVPGLPVRISKELLRSPNCAVCSIHIHDDIEILAGTEGCLLVELENKKFHLSPGDVIIINRRVPHSTTQLEHYTTNILIQFRIEKLRAEEFDKINKYLSFILAGNEMKYVYLDKTESKTKELYGLIKKIHEENVRELPEYEIFIKGYMEILLGMLYRNKILVNIEDSYNKEAIKKIWPVIEYIDHNYPYKMTLEQMAKKLGLNREYFCRIFKDATNITPIEYINYVRVMKAETLLTTSTLSILEISLDVGFASVSYFNRVFKKLKGITPSTYKKITYAKNKLI